MTHCDSYCYCDTPPVFYLYDATYLCAVNFSRTCIVNLLSPYLEACPNGEEALVIDLL